MSYREEGTDAPDTNMRSYMCMRAFPLEVGGMGENMEAHKWLNLMRKDGWHLVSTATGFGEIPIAPANQYAGVTKRSGTFITFVMEGTKPDPATKGDRDQLYPIQDALLTTQSYGNDQW